MKRESIEPYIGKEIKLVLDRNFILNGVIMFIDDSHISFKTNKKTSLIHFDRIMEVTPL